MKLVAVLGAGTMGSSIAAQIASSGVEVLLLDIAGKNDKNEISLLGLERATKFFTSEEDKKFITIGNFDEDLHKISEADWVIEVIIEDLSAKIALFKKIEPYLNPNAVVSSNTSTIPLSEILGSVTKNIAERMLITHFFNPPRYLSLLEIVRREKEKDSRIEGVINFCINRLGKKIVFCKDTTGFIANRIGFFWLCTAVVLALELGLSAQEADFVVSKNFMGIPKTGVFGLIDLIGLDVFMFIMESLVERLPKKDPLCKIFAKPVSSINITIKEFMNSMIKNGYLGRKSKSGFYRKDKSMGGSVLQMLNFNDMKYSNIEDLHTPNSAKVFESFDTSTKHGKFLTTLFARTLGYVANLIPDTILNIQDVDTVMKYGYNWNYGLFQLVDNLSKSLSGSFFSSSLLSSNIQIPPLLQNTKKFFTKDGFLCPKGSYQAMHKDFLILSDLKGEKPIINNLSANLWDIGNGIACFDICDKNRALDMHVFRLLYDSLNIVEKYFSGMVIGGDKKDFSLGVNLNFIFSHIKDEFLITNLLSYGQELLTIMRDAKFPIVAAVSGNALGGGCELMMHSHSIVAHVESYVGFAECRLGLIPSFGGCNQIILNTLKSKVSLQSAFDNVLNSRATPSAKYIQSSNFATGKVHVEMNRDKLILSAKEMVMSMLESDSKNINKLVVDNKITDTEKIVIANLDQLSEHDKKVAYALADIFTLGEDFSEAKILEKERNVFISLLRSEEVYKRIRNIIHR